MTPNDPSALLFGLLAAAVAVGGVVQGRVPRSATAPVSGVYVDPTGGPCSVDRWELACERLREKGWGCVLGPGGVPVYTLNPAEMGDGDRRGAHRVREGRDEIALAVDACGTHDPTAEHELVSHVLGLGDCKHCPTGDVRATPSDRTGLRIPERRP